MPRRYLASDNSKVITGLTVAILVVSIGAEALAGYTFFVVLPPALNNVNTAAWDLINYNPGTGSEFRNGATDLDKAANNLRNTGRTLPCAYDCNLAGVQLFSMKDTRRSLEALGDNLESLGKRANNLGKDFDQTVTVIHSVGYGALGIKDGLYYGIMIMLGLGAAGILTGIGLLVTAGTLRRLEKVQT